MSDSLPTLDKIIDRNPVTVGYDAAVIDAITLMSRVQSRELATLDAPQQDLKKSSYVLVTRGVELAGIFTERDLVKLIADGIEINNKKIAEVMSANVITLKQYYNRDITVAIAIMRKHKIRHLPVVSSWGELIGIITRENIRSALTPSCLLKMRSVADVMNVKVIQAFGNASPIEIAKLMSQHRVSCVVIVENSDRDANIPIGIVTERDLVRFRVLELDLAKIKIASVMSQPLFPVHPNDSLWQTHQLMRARKVRRLVAINKSGELAGIITQSSILQIFDPLEMSRVITVLQQQIDKRTEQLKQAYQKLERQEREKTLQLERIENFEAIADNVIRDIKKTIDPIVNSARILSLKYPDADRQTEKLLQLIADNAQKSIDLLTEIFTFNNSLDRK